MRLYWRGFHSCLLRACAILVSVNGSQAWRGKQRVSVVSLGTESVSKVYCALVSSKAGCTGEELLQSLNGRYRRDMPWPCRSERLDLAYLSRRHVSDGFWGDLHGQRSSGTCREGTQRSVQIALSKDPARCCRVTDGPVPPKGNAGLARSNICALHFALPNDSVAGPRAINGCGNGPRRIIALRASVCGC
jgi:hypothetical protein